MKDDQNCEVSLSLEKAAKCLADIDKALYDRELHPGTAQKLAGRLGWASQHLFRRVGRAMLVPLFQRAHSGCGVMCFHVAIVSCSWGAACRQCELCKDLEVALRWW